MIPCSFDESNAVLDKPPNLSDDECTCLSVLKTKTLGGAPVVISCWKVTKDELEEIQVTGRVWLVVRGYTMPPVALETLKPFRKEGDE